MATPAGVNKDLLAKLLAESGGGITIEPPSAEVTKPNVGAAIAALIPGIASGLVLGAIFYGIGAATIYVLRNVGLPVPEQPWYGPLIFGVLVVQIGGYGWKSKK